MQITNGQTSASTVKGNERLPSLSALFFYIAGVFEKLNTKKNQNIPLNSVKSVITSIE